MARTHGLDYGTFPRNSRPRALIAERDNLIRYAVQREATEREVAELAGLAHSRVHEIVHRGR